MPDETRRSIRGVSIFERRIGAGPEVVVLHGGPGAHHDYLLPPFDALARGRTLIYYDQRGGGRSPVPRDVPVGADDQVADLEALRESWALPRLTMVGYSWGGLLALLYAARFPARVGRLALVSPAPLWAGARREFEHRLAARARTPWFLEQRRRLHQSGLREADPEAYRQRLFELAVAGYFKNPELARDLTPFRITERTQKEVWASLGEYDLRPALRELSLPEPVMVVHGEDDPIPAGSARETAQILGAEFHLLPDCGHVPYLEAFPAFVAVLDGFLPRRDS